MRVGGGGAAISSYKCICTTPIGAPIYIWPCQTPVPPLEVHIRSLINSK